MKKLALLLSIMTASSAHAQRQAYVVNSLAETLSIIDLETGQVTNHAVALGEAPNQAAYHDGFLYVVNSISADIMKIDPADRQIVAEIYLAIGSNPYYMAFSENHCFVTGFVSGAVYRIDLSTNVIDGQTDVGGFPEGIVYADGLVYVTQTYFNPDDYSYGQGMVSVINASTMSVEGQFEVGTNPQWISKSDIGELHIVCTGNYFDILGSVYIYGPAEGEIVDSVNIGGTPASLAISPLGIGYLAAGGWEDEGLVFAYDIDSREIINGPGNPIETGLGVTCVAVDSLGFLYSTDMGDDTITKMSSSGGYLGNFSVGDGPVFLTIVDDAVLGIEDNEHKIVPENMAILSNYPNPFNSSTVIWFEIENVDVSDLRVYIYDQLGRIVKRLSPGTEEANGSVFWDGTDNLGSECSSGVYFAGLSGRADGDGRKIEGWMRKMVLVR